MKSNSILFFFLLLGHTALAQGELADCAYEKNMAIDKILSGKQQLDSATRTNLYQLQKKWESCIVGQPIPHFNKKSIDGKKINTKNFYGRIMVINFWFTACPPCLAELPALNRLVAEYKDKGVVFLGVTNDRKPFLDTAFLPKYQFDFTIIPEAVSVEEAFGISEHPATFIIDAEGKVVKAWVGGSTGEEAKTEAYLKAKTVIDELLTQKKD